MHSGDNYQEIDQYQEQIILKAQLIKIKQAVDQTHHQYVDKLIKIIPEYYSGYLQKTTLQNLFRFKQKYVITNPTNSPVCSKIIGKDKTQQKGFRCYDCMQCDHALICTQCFLAGDHKNHRYLQFCVNAGSCDCGNEETWDQKGACPDHSNCHKTNIDEQLTNKFVLKVKIKFYLYFWLRSKENQYYFIDDFTTEYANHLLTSLTEFIEQNQQCKIMCFRLLSEHFGCYPPIQGSHLTILQYIFHLNPDSIQLPAFTNILFELFPVQQCRAIVIKQYFLKTLRNEQFPHSHKLKTLNYQFMICVKMINKLIKQKQLKPYQLDPDRPLTSIKELTSAFKRSYEDFVYIAKMKACKEYHKLHLQLAKVSDMAFYRKYTAITQNDGETTQVILIDDFFVKTIGLLILDVRHQTDIIKKCLRELFQYISNVKQMCYSLAQERAFSMFVVAYCQGNIGILNNYENASKLCEILGINQTVKKQLFKRLIKLAVMSKAKSGKYELLAKQNQTNYQKFFHQCHPQKQMTHCLDTLYHKILLMLAKDSCSYDEIVYELLNELMLLKQNNGLVHKIVSFLNSIVAHDFDELLVANYIGIVQKDRVFALYEHLLASYCQLNSKQFKSLTLEIINNIPLFQQFMKNNVQVQQTKLKNKNAFVQEYPFIIYQDQFAVFKYKLEDRGRQPSQSNYFVLANRIWNHQTINLFIQHCRNIIEMRQQNEEFVIHSTIKQLIKMYVITNNQMVLYFISEINNSQQLKIQNRTMDLINKYVNIPHNSNNSQNKNEESDQKKKKILKKKKQTEQKIKKQQKSFLDKYIVEHEQMQQKQICIYCKQHKPNETLQYLGYCNFTNLFQAKKLKNNQFHIYFTTCGHQIHRICYQYYFNKKQQFYCLLCKRQVNFILPQFTKTTINSTQQEKQIKAKDLLNFIHPMLLQCNQNRQILVETFMKLNQNNSVASIMGSMVKQIVISGMQNGQNFKKTIFPIMNQIYQIIRYHPKELLNQSFQILDKQFKSTSQTSNYLTNCFQYTYQQLKNKLFVTHIQNKTTLQLKYQVSINKVLSLFDKDRQGNIVMIDQLDSEVSLLLDLPQHISDLSKYRGECKVCSKLTNWIYVCLLCGWRACIPCLKMRKSIKEHLQRQHYDGSIMICCYNGNVLYAFDENIHDEVTLYENYLGQAYTQVQCQQERLQIQNFTINTKKKDKLYQNLVEHNIHNIAANH